MKNDDISDAELDAFLNGEDALSRRLRALPQPSSSARLDAAILGHVQAALEQERRPQAANDAGAPQLAPSFARRWRVPVGLAATVLAGVFAHQAFQASNAREEAALMPAVAEMAPPPAAAEMAPPPPPPAAAAAPVAGAAVAATPAAPAVEKPRAQPRAKLREEVKPVQERAEEAVQMKAAPAPAAPAPAPVAIPDLRRALANEVTVSGSRIQTQAVHKSAEEWLGIIDTLLKAKLDEDAKAEWTRFKKAYPDHPVPEDIKARLER